MKHEPLSIIDIELGTKLTGGNEEMAHELLDMLITALPEHQQEITLAYQTSNLEELRLTVHKLHGATCYTGTPRLKNAVQQLEQAAKTRKTTDLPLLYQSLLIEISAVLTQGASIVAHKKS